MTPSSPEFSIELTAQELLAPTFRLEIIAIEDMWTFDPTLNTRTEALNDDRLVPPTSDEVELDLTAEQIDLLLLTGSIGR
jgi:hypothetical protein